MHQSQCCLFKFHKPHTNASRRSEMASYDICMMYGWTRDDTRLQNFKKRIFSVSLLYSMDFRKSSIVVKKVDIAITRTVVEVAGAGMAGYDPIIIETHTLTSIIIPFFAIFAIDFQKIPIPRENSQHQSSCHGSKT